MKKINKNKAKRIYNEGYEIHILPCKVGLNNMWTNPYIISNKENDKGFDWRVKVFEVHNCGLELGKYSHFYTK